MPATPGSSAVISEPLKKDTGSYSVLYASAGSLCRSDKLYIAVHSCTQLHDEDGLPEEG